VALKAPRTSTSQLELLIGFTAGIGGFLFLITVWLELTGQAALLWALLLAAAVGVLGVLLLRRRRIMRSVSGGPSTSREG
jgi:hypothetical protein